jgi:hypothetical protein
MSSTFFSNVFILTELHTLDLILCHKLDYKIDLLRWIVVPQLSGGRLHSHSTKTRQAGRDNEQSIYSYLYMGIHYLPPPYHPPGKEQLQT